MFGLMVRFHCTDEASAAEFDALVADTVPLIREREPGTLIYTVHTVEGQPLQRIFYELYRDRAAFDAHEQQEHVKHFLAARDSYLDSVDVDWLELTVGKGASS